MNFQFLRLVVLLILQLAGLAQAATLNFNGGAVAGCTYSSPTYSCATIPYVNFNDTAIIASGYTVYLTSSVGLGYNQVLQMSGSATLQTASGVNMDLSQNNPSVLNVTGNFISGGNFLLAGRLTGPVSASGSASVTGNGTLTGALTATSLSTGSNVTLGSVDVGGGAINVGSSTTINGAVSGGSITTNADVTLGSTLTLTGTANLGSRTAISGAVSVASIVTNSDVSFGSSLTATGLVNLSSSNTVAGTVNAGSVQTNSSVTINGAIVSSGSVSLGSHGIFKGDISGTVVTGTSPVDITGNVTASTSFTLPSGSTLTGNLSAPTVALLASQSVIKGNISASTSLSIESGNQVTGNVTGGSLTMASSNVVITGNVTMTGDVNMGSSATINGDLVARNVVTHPSGDYISGNASVNSIDLSNSARVGKTITCNGGGASNCSCVSNSTNTPGLVCGAPPVSNPDHILITHSGTALTCQPQTVALTACANSSCTAPHFTGSSTVTLQPGNAQVTFTGTGSGTVSQTTTGSQALTATMAASGVGATTCLNTANNSNSCNMAFADTGLVLSVPDHLSETSSMLTISALQSPGNGATCVPQLVNASPSINFTCGYVNPASAATSTPMPLRIGGTPLAASTTAACSSGGAGVTVNFDGSGVGRVALQYADVGQMSLSARYTQTGGNNAGRPYAGSTSFVVAPASFGVAATRDGGPLSPATAFAKAGEVFTVTISALNNSKVVTANFGRETTPETPALSELLKDPSNGQNAFALNANGTTNNTSSSNGVTTIKNSLFNETGTITLTGRLANATGYYMGKTTVNGFATTGSADIGRFIPDHFDTALIVPPPSPAIDTDMTMSCQKQGGLQNPCAYNGKVVTATSKFIYSKQPFDIIVTAYNAKLAPATTYAVSQNYVGTTAQPITLSAWNAPGATGVANQLPAQVGGAVVGGMFWYSSAAPGVYTPDTTAAAAPVRFSFASANSTVAGTVQPSYLPGFAFAYATPDTVTAPTDIYIRATDADGATSQRAGAVEALLTVVSGRLQLGNNYGSDSSAMPVSVKAMLWTGTSYVLNTQYQQANTTPVSVALSGKVSYSRCTKNLGTTTTSNVCPTGVPAQPNSTLQLANGTGQFVIPVTGKTGSVDVTLIDPASPLPVIPYLPTVGGRATFGVYRGGPVVYTREVF